MPKGFSINLVNDIFSQLQISLLFDRWYDNNKYLLFNNGVLDVETKNFYLLIKIYIYATHAL
ncbi:hypothetical protein EBQ91_01530 [bacterium]|nr:hypothetical protein [bacterium]